MYIPRRVPPAGCGHLQALENMTPTTCLVDRRAAGVFRRARARAGALHPDVHRLIAGSGQENAVVYTNPNVVVQPVVTYDPAVTPPLGEGDEAVVTVTNNYEGVNLLGVAVNLTPKFTG